MIDPATPLRLSAPRRVVVLGSPEVGTGGLRMRLEHNGAALARAGVQLLWRRFDDASTEPRVIVDIDEEVLGPIIKANRPGLYPELRDRAAAIEGAKGSRFVLLIRHQADLVDRSLGAAAESGVGVGHELAGVDLDALRWGPVISCLSSLCRELTVVDNAVLYADGDLLGGVLAGEVWPSAIAWSWPEPDQAELSDRGRHLHRSVSEALGSSEEGTRMRWFISQAFKGMGNNGPDTLSERQRDRLDRIYVKELSHLPVVQP